MTYYMSSGTLNPTHSLTNMSFAGNLSVFAAAKEFCKQIKNDTVITMVHFFDSRCSFCCAIRVQQQMCKCEVTNLCVQRLRLVPPWLTSKHTDSTLTTLYEQLRQPSKNIFSALPTIKTRRITQSFLWRIVRRVTLRTAHQLKLNVCTDCGPKYWNPPAHRQCLEHDFFARQHAFSLDLLRHYRQCQLFLSFNVTVFVNTVDDIPAG